MSPTTPYPLKGEWQPGVRWEFVATTTLPPLEQSTTVGCVLISEEGLVLTRTSRGCWELPGGHIEANEGFLEALHREGAEEGRVKIQGQSLFGVTVVDCQANLINPSSGQPYPKKGFIPHFVAWGDSQRDLPLGQEILEIKTITFDRLHEIDPTEMPGFAVLQIGLLHYSQLPSCKQQIRVLIVKFLTEADLCSEEIKLSFQNGNDKVID